MPTAAPTQTTEYLYSQPWQNAANTGANAIKDYSTWANNTYNDWTQNSPSINAPVNSTLQNAWSQMAGGTQQPWINDLNTAQNTVAGAMPYMGQAGAEFAGNANYNPSHLQQYLNPYVNDAANATMEQTNRNLFQNVLPNINSTFAGSGQFGSTRNADFTNRAVADNQQRLGETLAKQNVSNYQLANQDYLNWAQQGNASASGLANLGTQMGNLGNTMGTLAGQGSVMSQTDLTNLLNSGNAQQTLQQDQLNREYADWQKQQDFRTGALGTMSEAIRNQSGAIAPNVQTPQAQPDMVSKILALVQAAGQGLADERVSDLATLLGIDFKGTR